jgi:hypothetical protein
MSKPGSALSSFAIFGTIPNPENRLQPWQPKALNPVAIQPEKWGSVDTIGIWMSSVRKNTGIYGSDLRCKPDQACM